MRLAFPGLPGSGTRSVSKPRLSSQSARWWTTPRLLWSSAADVQLSYPVEAAAAGRAGFTAQSHPKLHAWLMRCQARPAYQRALAAGGPYSVIP